MTTIEYVPLEAALLDVFSIADNNHFTKPEAEEWASWAMQKLTVKQNYQEEIVLLPISNYKACLPRGTKYIWQIVWKETLEKNDLETITLYTGNESGVDKKFMSFANNNYFKVNWAPMRASTTPFTRSVLCENAPQTAQCSHTYSVNKDYTITTTLKEGCVAIALLSYPKNEAGEFLIPKDQEIMQALKNYVLSKIWERQMNFGVENAERMFDRYWSLWEISAANARGKQLLLGIDQLENFKQQNNRIGQHNHSYNTGFGNLAHGETITF